MTPAEPAPTPPPRQVGWGRRAGLGALVLLAALVVAAGLCEWFGWPFLAQPVQRGLSQALDRKISLGGEQASLRVHLLGHLRIEAPYLEIGAPSWSQAPHLLVARNTSVTLGYGDLWRARNGAPLRVRSLRASEADVQLERLADGRASWQFGKPPPPGTPPTAVPLFDRLDIVRGGFRYTDVPLKADVIATFALTDGSAAAAGSANRLTVDANGRLRGLPLKLQLQSSGVLPLLADAASAPAVPMQIDATIGRARLAFKGSVTDALRLAALQGRFTLSGPSLASVGDPLGVTLPTTSAFRIDGLLARDGKVWRTVIDSATVGASRLNGAFSYDAGRATPMLAGRLGGSKLLLADRRAEPAVAAPVSTKPGRTLPDRAFDLPALRAMDANVLIDIATVDLGSTWLEPLEPLRTHLVLSGGVLSLNELEARTAQGLLAGSVQLDGRAPRALWTVDLRWSDVQLERFIRQARAKGLPPYVSGKLRGEAKLAGQGRSTAELLGSLRGNVRTQLRDGAVSHLIVEAAGIDIAQSLGVLFKGDDALPVTCGVADLAVADGTLTPRVMVIDTDDSTIWVDGTLSLATEKLDLRAVVSPKDFSPLALRTPVRVGGSFAQPAVSLEKGPLGRTIGAAALLALINPLAALIPLVDLAQPDDAKHGAAGCLSLVKRGTASKAVAPGRVKRS